MQNPYHDKRRAEMYLFENTTEASIEAADQWHPGIGQTEGESLGFTFEAGSSKDISSFADYSGTVAGTIKATTSASHGYATGDIVSLVGGNIAIGGANEYAGVYEITVVDADEFYFTNANWNATTAAKSLKPDTFTANVGSAGTYVFDGGGSFTSAANDKSYDFSAFLNTTQQEKASARIVSKNATEYSTVSGRAFLDVSDGDKFWFAIKGVTDATNFTLRDANTIIHKL
jgi:hypothetical protein